MFDCLSLADARGNMCVCVRASGSVQFVGSLSHKHDDAHCNQPVRVGREFGAFRLCIPDILTKVDCRGSYS